jgi:hypothetical protein
MTRTPWSLRYVGTQFAVQERICKRGWSRRWPTINTSSGELLEEMEKARAHVVSIESYFRGILKLQLHIVRRGFAFFLVMSLRPICLEPVRCNPSHSI